MKWKIDYLEEDGVVYMQTFGPANWDANRKMCEEALALARKKGTNRFIVDHRKLKHGLSILQVDNIPRMLKEIGVTSEDRMAIVFDPKSPMGDTFHFFRNTSFIESLQVQLFPDSDKAIACLKSDSPGKPKE